MTPDVPQTVVTPYDIVELGHARYPTLFLIAWGCLALVIYFLFQWLSQKIKKHQQSKRFIPLSKKLIERTQEIASDDTATIASLKSALAMAYEAASPEEPELQKLVAACLYHPAPEREQIRSALAELLARNRK